MKANTRKTKIETYHSDRLGAVTIPAPMRQCPHCGTEHYIDEKCPGCGSTYWLED